MKGLGDPTTTINNAAKRKRHAQIPRDDLPDPETALRKPRTSDGSIVVYRKNHQRTRRFQQGLSQIAHMGTREVPQREIRLAGGRLPTALLHRHERIEPLTNLLDLLIIKRLCGGGGISTTRLLFGRCFFTACYLCCKKFIIY